MTRFWHRAGSVCKTRAVGGRREAHRRSIIPALEALEDRTLLSTFAVSNLDDAGAGSLRQAVTEANALAGADVIEFAPRLKGTIVLTRGELAVTDDLTIKGLDKTKLTITGNHASRVFHISDSATDVVIRDLAIANGLTTGTTALGGAILNDSGRLTLTGMTFTGNLASGIEHPNGAAGGGAVASVHRATLIITDSLFMGNQTVGTHRGEGGAILSDDGSSLTISDSSFSGNRSTGLVRDLERFFWFGGNGGAISTLGSSGTASIVSTEFHDNQALGADGAPSRDGALASGGAIYNGISLVDEGVDALAGILTIDDCTFTENAALAGAGGPAVAASAGGSGGIAGGGALVNDIGGRLTITDTIFRANRSIGGDGGAGSDQAPGGDGSEGISGAIHNQRGHLIVRSSSMIENHASGGEGGSSPMKGGKGGGGKGGAIHTPNFDGLFPPGEEGIVELDDVIVRGNRATGGAGGDSGDGPGGNGGPARGGGLSVNRGTMYVRTSIVDVNSAIGGPGGQGSTRGNGGAVFGAGISIGQPLADGLDGPPKNFVVVSHSSITGNILVGGTGAIGGIARGGALYNSHRATASVSATLLESNEARGGDGIVTGGNGLGGGVFNEQNSDVTLYDSTIMGNRAIGGAGSTFGEGIGGGIYNVSGGIVWVDALTLIFANDASTSDDDVFGILTPL